VIGVVAITCDAPNFALAYDDLVAGMEVTMKDAEVQFQKTTRTWKGKPAWTKKITKTPLVIEGEVFTESDIYRYVSEGTRIRYATMTPDFVPKTVSGFIGSRAGRGGLLFVNKRRPRPGIKARQFAESVADKLGPYFYRYMEMALDRVAQQSGHSI
jgi:hypothetical protein